MTRFFSDFLFSHLFSIFFSTFYVCGHVFRIHGIACVKKMQCFASETFWNHRDPKVQTFSKLFGDTFEDFDDFKMHLHFVFWFWKSIFGFQALRDISLWRFPLLIKSHKIYSVNLVGCAQYANSFVNLFVLQEVSVRHLRFGSSVKKSAAAWFAGL